MTDAAIRLAELRDELERLREQHRCLVAQQIRCEEMMHDARTRIARLEFQEDGA